MSSARISPRTPDADTDRVLRNHDERLRNVEGRRALGLTVIQGIELVSGVVTPVAHKLGRVPVIVIPGAPRGAVTTGRIEEIRDGTQNRSKIVALKATGWGATIQIDLGVL